MWPMSRDEFDELAIFAGLPMASSATSRARFNVEARSRHIGTSNDNYNKN